MAGGNVRLSRERCASDPDIEERGNGGICSKTRGRAWSHSPASRARVLHSGGAGPFCLPRVLGSLGEAPGTAVRRLFAGARTQDQAEFVSRVQPAVPDANQGRVANSELARSSDQTAKGWSSAAGS